MNTQTDVFPPCLKCENASQILKTSLQHGRIYNWGDFTVRIRIS